MTKNVEDLLKFPSFFTLDTLSEETLFEGGRNTWSGPWSWLVDKAKWNQQENGTKPKFKQTFVPFLAEIFLRFSCSITWGLTRSCNEPRKRSIFSCVIWSSYRDLYSYYIAILGIIAKFCHNVKFHYKRTNKVWNNEDKRDISG